MTFRIVCLGGLTRCEGSLVGVIEATFGISHLGERHFFIWTKARLNTYSRKRLKSKYTVIITIRIIIV